MPDYAIFGGTLRSHLEFPELECVAPHAPSWTFGMAERAPTTPVLELLGQLGGSRCQVMLARTSTGYRLHHSCTGTYEVHPTGTIEFWPVADDSVGSVQADLIGRVLPAVLELSGLSCLHGSCVDVGGRALGFLADSGTGKSTLAAALVGAGARLVSDDAMVVELGSHPSVRQGVHQIRLRRDAASHDLAREFSQVVGADGKRVIRGFRQQQVMCGSAPLDAIYLLKPFTGLAADPAVARLRIGTVPAAMELMRNTKAGMLLTGTAAAGAMQRALQITGQVPVYELRIVRDLHRIRNVAEQVIAWHADHPATSATLAYA